jgi:hypothetical protein
VLTLNTIYCSPENAMRQPPALEESLYEVLIPTALPAKPVHNGGAPGRPSRLPRTVLRTEASRSALSAKFVFRPCLRALQQLALISRMFWHQTTKHCKASVLMA